MKYYFPLLLLIVIVFNSCVSISPTSLFLDGWAEMRLLQTTYLLMQIKK